MFVPVPYTRPDGGSLPPGAALVPGGFPPMGPPPPGGPMGPLPLVLAPGFAPGAMPPLIEREPIDVCKLFVGGLNPNTTEAELEDYFKQYGAVGATLSSKQATSCEGQIDRRASAHLIVSPWNWEAYMRSRSCFSPVLRGEDKVLVCCCLRFVDYRRGVQTL